MDLSYGPEYETFREEVRDFIAVNRHLAPKNAGRVARPSNEGVAWQKLLIEHGYTARTIPREYGGFGAEPDILKSRIIAEEFARAGVPGGLANQGISMLVPTLLELGTEEQKRRWIGEILAAPGDRLAALAFTEVTGGANYNDPDPQAGVQTFARREGDEWVITGKKHYTTNGSGWDGKGAHLLTVVCRTDPTLPPQESLAVIIVPGATPGVDVVGYLDTSGHRAVVSPIIHFNNVRVPVGNIIGKPGDGIRICSGAFTWTAALIGAACVGVMRAAFDCAYQFALSDRRSGTVPVIQHQNVGYMLADLKMSGLAEASEKTLKGRASGSAGAVKKLIGKPIDSGLAFRKLVAHLRARNDVQNIDMMNLTDRKSVV